MIDLDQFERRTADRRAGIVDIIAKQFSDILRQWITPDQMDEVIRLNAARENKSICHTHDYCDANQAMLDAFASLGLFDDDTPWDEWVITPHLGVSQLCDDAWKHAQEHDFFP